VLAEAKPAQAGDLLERFGGLMAQLHRLDWRPFTDQAERYESDPGALLEDLLAPARLQYAQMGVAGFLTVLDWLESRRSEIRAQAAVVHLDLHANNVFLGADGRLAVIDWSQISVTDFRVDLAWTLMIMGDYGQPGWRERILGAYERQSARGVENLGYFEVLADLKLLASTVIALRSGPEALGLHPDAYQTAGQQAATLRRLAWRIRAATDLTIPEVEAVPKSV
jgi:aminoglycoside phosphotransferase (APT) family kinase protein